METVKRKFGAHAVSTSPERSREKFILTGLSGIGKSYFLSTIPGIFFLAVEEGLKGVSPEHVPAHFADEQGRCIAPQSFQELMEALRVFKDEINAVNPTTRKRPHAHLGVDSLTGVERLIHKQACGKERVDHMEGKEFGAVWRAAIPLWDQFRTLLDDIRRSGVHLWLVAHSVETENANHEGEIFKRWDLLFSGSQRMANEVRQFWRGWADHVYFIDWTTTVTKRGKGKASIGKFGGRVLCTKETARYYAKHRGRLPDTIPATWPDLARALQASASSMGSAAEQAKLSGQIEAVIARLRPEDAIAIRADLKTATGASALSAVLSRAHGMLAIASEDEEDAGDDSARREPGDAASPDEPPMEPPPSSEDRPGDAVVTHFGAIPSTPATENLRSCETTPAVDVMLVGMLEIAPAEEHRDLVLTAILRRLELVSSPEELKAEFQKISEHKRAGRLSPADEEAFVKSAFVARKVAMSHAQQAA